MSTEELREAMERWLRDRVQVPEHRAITASFAFLALPEVAALIADADNWRRATTGDPTEPLPLAMQARDLLVRNRELEAAVARVREVADEIHRRGTAEVAAMDDEPDEYRKNQNASRASTYARAEHLIRQALDGDQ